MQALVMTTSTILTTWVTCMDMKGMINEITSFVYIYFLLLFFSSYSPSSPISLHYLTLLISPSFHYRLFFISSSLSLIISLSFTPPIFLFYSPLLLLTSFSSSLYLNILPHIYLHPSPPPPPPPPLPITTRPPYHPHLFFLLLSFVLFVLLHILLLLLLLLLFLFYLFLFYFFFFVLFHFICLISSLSNL